MEKRYFVNIDYEFQLFDDNYDSNYLKYKKFNSEFEHLFLWLESDKKTLSNLKSYDSNYLDYIASLKNEGIPAFSDRPGEIPWWGSLRDIELARRLNSKRTSFHLAKKYNFLPEGSFLIETDEDFSTLKDFSKECIVKKLDSFSGIGNKIVKKKSDVNFKPPFIIEPYLNVVKEFGLTVEADNYFLVETIQNQKNNFSGAFVGEFLEKKEIYAALKPLLKDLAKQSLGDSFEIDCLYYENSERVLYPLVEINYRKTMSYFAAKFAQKMEIRTGFWSLYENKFQHQSFEVFTKSIKDLLYTREKKSGIVLISPLDSKYISFYFIQENKKKIQELVYDLERTLELNK
jgi:hypothetical protein